MEKKKGKAALTLEKALQKRLEALTSGLEHVEVTGKGIDYIKEIKELHSLLQSMRQQAEGAGKEAQAAPRLVVVWGNELLPLGIAAQEKSQEDNHA